MTIFAILLPTPQQILVDKIKGAYPNDHLSLNSTQYLVSSTETAIDVTARIGVYDASNKTEASIGNAVVLAVSSYYGRAQPNVWDWIKSKMEASSHG